MIGKGGVFLFDISESEAAVLTIRKPYYIRI
jgi:hypothetical protein